MYRYLDLSHGIKLCETHDPEILTQEKRLYIGKDVSDEEVIAMLKGGIDDLGIAFEELQARFNRLCSG